MRHETAVCATCGATSDDPAKAGQRCDRWGCGGRYQATLFPEGLRMLAGAADRTLFNLADPDLLGDQ